MNPMTVMEKLLLDTLFQVADFYQSRLQKISIKSMITLLRKRLRMSQRVLAKRAKIPQATLSRIESGKTKPNVTTLEKIFKALFCDIALIALPACDFDQIVRQQIHLVAKKRVQYLKGTMALELQQPKDEVIQELILREEGELGANKHFDIWSVGESDDCK